MRKPVKTLVAIGLGAAVVTGLAACDGFPVDIPTDLPTQLPSISIPPLPTGDPAPRATVTVTAEPAPAPTVTVTVTGDPGSQPVVTVTADPGPRPTATVTADPGDPNPQPTVTVTSVVTATPSPSPSVTPSPTVSPTVSPSPDAPADDATSAAPWWPWLLLGIVVAGLLFWWWSTAATRARWTRRLAAARSRVAWTEDAVASQVLAQASAPEALALWQAERLRALELDRELYALSTGASAPAQRTSAGQGRVVLAELIAALDAETAPDAPTGADALRASRARVDQARAQVRNWVAAGEK